MAEMHQIFLAPRSNETAYKHFKSTIEHGVEYRRVAPFLSVEGKKLLKKDKLLYVWGNVGDKKSSWDKMNPGDYVLFYAKGKFRYVGKLKYKQFDEKLSLSLWPRNKKGKTWPCVFFLYDVREIDIPMKKIRELGK